MSVENIGLIAENRISLYENENEKGLDEYYYTTDGEVPWPTVNFISGLSRFFFFNESKGL